MPKVANRIWFPFRKKSQNGNPATISVSTAKQPIENLLTREWLLTNERGSYASSTISGCNTRGYHGLLIGSLRPPINRIMALSNCLEMVIINGQAFNLSTFEFKDKFTPSGFGFLKKFRRDTAAHFDYELDKLELTKSLYLLHNSDTVALVYDFKSVHEPTEFVLRPFVGLRDYHTLQQSHASLYSRTLGDGVLVRHRVPSSCELLLSCPSSKFVNDRQWWFNFVYRNNRERGQDFTEDLWTPGFFKCRIERPAQIVLWAKLTPPWARCKPNELSNLDIDTVRKDLDKHRESILDTRISMLDARKKEKSRIKHRDSRIEEALCLTAEAFIAKRQTNHHHSPEDSAGRRPQADKRTSGQADLQRTTILAGYPWFSDWGRDAFIALPGLLLSTGRFDEAKSVLTTFVTAADEGMIPNHFDDSTVRCPCRALRTAKSSPKDSLRSTAHFNSVDASFWFINAAFQYLHASGDSETFTQEFMPTIRWIIDSYYKGTRFDIHADVDGLITAGDNETQLTWMDAKYNGIAFTPRCGKAVEVNALWYNSLCLLGQFFSELDIENAKHYESTADKVRASFCEVFWNESKDYLNDCILPDGSTDDSLRPNQIFAVSLPFSPLSVKQQKSVVKAVQNQLLTPYGLRTLNVQDSRYKGSYTGPQAQRDEAYHQGTVWAFLLGPFVESYLKVNGFSRKSKKKAAEFIRPLLQHLTKDGCLGSISEIFDGDAPHNPKGCIAQAWSVAELLRAYQLINS